jgi:hypothetical protein
MCEKGLPSPERPGIFLREVLSEDYSVEIRAPQNKLSLLT